MDRPLGTLLFDLYTAGDPIVRRFLNKFGLEEFGNFELSSPELLAKKGVYAYVLNGKVVYVGRCRDRFRNRINQGYGHVHPKNCFIDGQSTNCRLNSLVYAERENIKMFICVLNSPAAISAIEEKLRSELKPCWNIL